MTKRVKVAILSMVLLSACSHSESIYTEGDTYSFAEGDIAILSRTFSKDKHFLDLHSPQAYRVIYYPFLYSRNNGVLKFIRYCKPMEMADYGNMMLDQRARLTKELQSIPSIEQSCQIKGVKSASYANAGRPLGARGGPQNTIGMTANVFSPKTKQWERQSIDFPDLP